MFMRDLLEKGSGFGVGKIERNSRKATERPSLTKETFGGCMQVALL
jgi:hypothetical protein